MGERKVERGRAIAMTTAIGVVWLMAVSSAVSGLDQAGGASVWKWAVAGLLAALALAIWSVVHSIRTSEEAGDGS